MLLFGSIIPEFFALCIMGETKRRLMLDAENRFKAMAGKDSKEKGYFSKP